MDTIPFLRPNLVKLPSYAKYLDEMDESRLYANYGPLNTRFEERVIEEMFGGIGSCVTVNNATSGLILAISQLKRAGKYAIMPSFTFAAAPLAALWCGLEPYFVDVDAGEWSVSEPAIHEALAHLGDEVAIVVPYATFGTFVRTEGLASLETQSGKVPVVIDAAASFGCRDGDEHFGQGFQGAVVFSFHATKAFGVGEGGLVYSADAAVVSGIRRAGNFGFTPNRESVALGLNSKMSEVTAAIALATLDAYPAKVERRLEIYDYYLTCLESAGAIEAGWQPQVVRGRTPHQFFPVLCPGSAVNQDRVERLAQRGIQARTYFSPACHQQAQFASLESAALDITNQLSARILSLPLFEDMNSGQVQRIVKALG